MIGLVQTVKNNVKFVKNVSVTYALSSELSVGVVLVKYVSVAINFALIVSFISIMKSRKSSLMMMQTLTNKES